MTVGRIDGWPQKRVFFFFKEMYGRLAGPKNSGTPPYTPLARLSVIGRVNSLIQALVWRENRRTFSYKEKKNSLYDQQTTFKIPNPIKCR